MKSADLIRLTVLLVLISPISRAQDVFDQGVAASRRGDDDRALELLKQAVELNPNRADAHAYLGATYLAISSRFATISEILKDPQASASMSDTDRLAATKMVASMPETVRLAEMELRRALELDPNNEPALQWLVILASNGRADLPEADRVRKTAETSALSDRLALAFADSSLRRLAESQRLLAVNTGNDSTGKRYSIAGNLIWSSWHEVMQRANRGPLLEPTGPFPNPMRQALRAKYGPQLHEGLADLQQALRLNPGNSWAMMIMGELIRDQAVLRDTQAEYDADVATAKLWMNRGFDATNTQSRPAATVPALTGVAGVGAGTPRLIRRVAPSYPPAAAGTHAVGPVHFAITIARDGRATNIRLLSGHPLLVEAAQDALKHWLWQPKTLNGIVVETETEVDVGFSNRN